MGKLEETMEAIIEEHFEGAKFVETKTGDGFEWEIEFSDVEVVRKHSIEVTWSDHEGDLPSSGKPSFRDLFYTAPVKDYLERGELNWEKGY